MPNSTINDLSRDHLTSLIRWLSPMSGEEGKSRDTRARLGDTQTSMLAFTVVAVVVGAGAGIGGICLTLLLHMVQHLAFGYSLNAILGPQSFLDGVTSASPMRRFAAVTGCGLVAGFGWAALRRWGRPLVGTAKAVKANDPTMPAGSTVSHALLQIVTVAMGSPLGRETAPRELGALFAASVSRYSGLSVRDSQIMIACGAGAGLAAVYNVPVAASIFIVEVLLLSARPVVLIPAVVSCATAAVVAQIGLGHEAQYIAPDFAMSTPLVVWAIVFGPFFGAAGYSFRKATQHAQSKTPKGPWLIAASLAAFVVVAALALHFPQLLGNGKGPAQLTFSDHMDPRLAIVLLLLKVFIILLVLRGGARGGLLTPGIATGALLATVVGSAWNLFFPHLPLSAFAVIGAAAFLSSSMSMPITAVALIVEMMHLPTPFLLPLALATAGATLMRLSLQRRATTATGIPLSLFRI